MPYYASNIPNEQLAGLHHINLHGCDIKQLKKIRHLYAECSQVEVVLQGNY
jgi:hypothetical protein